MVIASFSVYTIITHIPRKCNSFQKVFFILSKKRDRLVCYGSLFAVVRFYSFIQLVTSFSISEFALSIFDARALASSLSPPITLLSAVNVPPKS